MHCELAHQHTAQVLQVLETVIKEVLYEDREKLLTEEARSRLGWVVGDDVGNKKVAGEVTKFEVNIADFFDQLAGTSTGGLLTLWRESSQ